MRVAPYPWLPGTDVPARLEDYAALFRSDFSRRDQAHWLAVYLRGLLRTSQRKNIPTIAQRADEPPARRIADPTQAIQNFINQSPWDERKLLHRFRGMVARQAGRRGAVVVSDVVFTKQGSQSVGVQRQYSREHQRKINCQVAVGLFHTAATHSVPVALRLYLPRRWSQTPERLTTCGVPAEYRVSATRARIALDLLDELREGPLAEAPVIPAPGYDDSEEFHAGLATRGLTEVKPAERASALQAAEAVCARMKAELGLDHFEGRSWRGFHHHAALAMLAYAFLTIEQQDWIADGAGI